MPTALITPGLAVSPMLAEVSPASPLIRAAAVLADPSTYLLPVKPRTVVNQQDVPCCVSCALGAAMEILHPDWPPLAPLFHYYVTRFDNGQADPDGFLFLAGGIATLTRQGICRHVQHSVPYTVQDAATKPSPEAFADALNQRIPRSGLVFNYRPLSGPSWVAAIRAKLRQNAPVVIGFSLPTGYPDSFLDSRFEWTDPQSQPPSGTGHCVVVHGYSDARQAVRVQDSRGAGAFENGGWWMAYRVVDSFVTQAAYSLLP